jgi:hypothetical protein
VTKAVLFCPPAAVTILVLVSRDRGSSRRTVADVWSRPGAGRPVSSVGTQTHRSVARRAVLVDIYEEQADDSWRGRGVSGGERRGFDAGS